MLYTIDIEKHVSEYEKQSTGDMSSEISSKIFWFFDIPHKDKNTHLSPVDQIFKNEQGAAQQQAGEIYFAGQYKRLSFSSRKTNRTNLRAVNASARLCWHLFVSLYLRW